MNIGNNIRRLRLAQGMTQEQLGDVLGVQKSAVQKYETGAVANIKPEAIMKMCAAFNVSPSVLMGWRDGAADAQRTLEEVALLLGEDVARAAQIVASLNDAGRARVVDILSDYSNISEYTTHDIDEYTTHEE